MSTTELVEKARALLAAATQGPLVVEHLEWVVVYDGPNENILFAESENPANAELIAFAVSNLPALLDALASEKQRADEAEAGAAAMREALRLEDEWEVAEGRAEESSDRVHDRRAHESRERYQTARAVALKPGAGAAFLARLHAAGSEVQRLRKDWDNALHAATSTMRSELRVAIRDADVLRAEVERLTDELAMAIRERDDSRTTLWDAEAERDRAVAQRDKAPADIAGLDGRLSGIHEHFRFELNKACGVNAHLQSHNDHLVEVNASLKSQVAEAGLCGELIAERDALRAEVEKESALRADLTAEVHRLRAEVEQLEARTATVCKACSGTWLKCPHCGTYDPVVEVHPTRRVRFMWACCGKASKTGTGGCDKCNGSGAVIVGG